MVAGEDEAGVGFCEGEDLIGAIEDVIEAAADDDVLVKCGAGDEVWICVDAKGEFLGFFPVGDFFKKGDVALEGGGAYAADGVFV